MNILHLAAGNRWTGAAAPAFAEVEALRAAGVDAHYAYVGGYKLEQKIGHLDFTHALIEKAQNPLSFRRTTRALRRFIREHGIAIVHAHLTYDHWLARFAAPAGVRIARTFHSRRVLRSDPFSRALLAKTDIRCVINDTFALSGAHFTPPPVDHRQFHPEGENVRSLYGIADDATLLVAIGKLTADRGFEQVLQTLAACDSAMRLMIIGHGPHRPALESLASQLGVAPRITWAGYHEDDLAEHYRAGDALLFTERGSDEGHRAILEAMACGVPTASYPIDGVAALTGPEHIAAAATPQALAAKAGEVVRNRNLRNSVAHRSHEFGYARAAERLRLVYEDT